VTLGPHAFFIIASYMLVGVTVLALIGWIVADHLRLKASLRDLEASGATRRSARKSSRSS
jgi:heme exporter protein D